MKKIRLDKIVRQSGCRTDGAIRFGQKADGSFYEIPLIIIEGKEPGQTLLVDCATHGDETEGTEAILRMAKDLENGDFSGTFVGVPALNMEAFTTIRRTSMVDEANLNRIYPGNKDTYITHRLAAVYLERVIPFVDVCITFHGGGDVLHLEPLVGYLPCGGEVEDRSRVLAEAFNFPYIWRIGNLPFSGCSATEYCALGVPTIVPEIGSHCGRLYDRQKNIGMSYEGIRNVMIAMEMLDMAPTASVEKKLIELHYIHSYNGGIQTPVKQPNEIVKEGETLCVMQDIYGNVIEELKAPWPGVVIGFWSVPVIHPGNWWSLFAKLL